MGRPLAYRSALLFLAALASVAACLAAEIAGSLAASGLAALTCVLVLVAFLAERRDGSQGTDVLLEKAAQAAGESRRLVIYEQATGLLAPWYVAMRGDEECARAHRFHRPLTLTLIETEADPDDWVAQGFLADWLRNHLRTVDIIGYQGDSRYIVLMPDTDIVGARRAVERLRSSFDSVRVAFACFPDDGIAFKHIQAAAEARMDLDMACAA